MTTDPFTKAARAEAERYWLETLQDVTVGIGELGQHVAEWARTRLAESRPLTPDGITDEARDRAYRAVAALSVCDWDDMSGVAKGRVMALVEGVITEITRPEPLKRPEGAEDWEDWLIEALPHESMPDEDIALLADRIAARVTEEAP